MKNLMIMVLAFTAIWVWSGCYTQVAVEDPNSSFAYDRGYTPDPQAQEDQYYDSESDSQDYYENPDYYPSNRRYYDYYYPGISIGLSWGAYWYDPFYWDPYYYSYWGSPYYAAYSWYPPYYSYYPPVCYWGGYYDPYYNYYGYYQRGDDVISHRNGDGLRGPVSNRTVSTRTNTVLQRDPQHRDQVVSVDSRSGRNLGTQMFGRENTSGRTYLSSERNKENLRNNLKRYESNTGRSNTLSKGNRNNNETLGAPRTNRNQTDLKNQLQKRTNNSIDKRKNTSTRKDQLLKRNNSGTTNKRPQVNRDNRSGNNNKSPQINRNGNTRQNTYSPPTRNSSPPQRTYSAPHNSGSNSSSAPRTNSGGNRGGRSR